MPGFAPSHPVPGTISASRAHRIALDLAVLGVILRISFHQGLDPAASVGVRIGLEIVYFTTVVGTPVLDLMHKNHVNNIQEMRMPELIP